MQTIIREIEQQIRNREENLRYAKDDAYRTTKRIEEDEKTLVNLKTELDGLLKYGEKSTTKE